MQFDVEYPNSLSYVFMNFDRQAIPLTFSNAIEAIYIVAALFTIINNRITAKLYTLHVHN